MVHPSKKSTSNISSPDQASAAVALPINQSDITPSIQSLIQLPTQQPAATSPALARFAVEARNFRQVEDQLWVDVCYLLPDTQDWMIGEAFLQVAGEKMPISGGSLNLYQPAGENGASGRRCDTLTFDIFSGLQAQDALLMINTMQAYPREGQYCDYLMNIVQPTLQARQTGIQLACDEGPGYSNGKVISKPAEMTQQQAEQIAFSSEYYSVSGPWSFPVRSLPTATPYPTVAIDDLQASPYNLLQTLYQIGSSKLDFPGWVYTQENWQHDIDLGSYGTTDSGVSLPQVYQRQSWYNLDKSGRVIQSVELLYDTDGLLKETTIFTNGQYWSPTTGSQSYPQQPFHLQIAARYIGSLEANLKAGYGSARHIEFEGHLAIQFSLDESLPISNPQWYNQSIQRDQVTAIFDTGSGQLQQIKTVVELADGSLRTLEFMKLDILSGIEPPQEVIEILAHAQNP